MSKILASSLLEAYDWMPLLESISSLDYISRERKY